MLLPAVSKAINLHPVLTVGKVTTTFNSHLYPVHRYVTVTVLLGMHHGHAISRASNTSNSCKAKIACHANLLRDRDRDRDASHGHGQQFDLNFALHA